MVVARPLLAPLPLVLLALAGPVSQAQAARVTGPKTVVPGARVTFHATTFHGGDQLSVVLQPTANRGGNGVGVGIKKTFLADAHGAARVRFRWPRRFFRCAGAHNCSKHRWKRGSRADVDLCGTVHGNHPGCGRAVVRIRNRHTGKPGPPPPAGHHTRVVHDRGYDNRPCASATPELDIRTVTVSYSKTDLKYAVKMRRASSFATVEIRMKVGHRAYVASGVPGGGVLDKSGHITGAVAFHRHGRRLVAVFARKAIGDPRSFRWRALTWPGGDCPTSDRAPNRGYVTQKLPRGA